MYSFFLNSDLKQLFIQKVIESIDLSATMENFVTKGEVKSNFLTTPTKETKIKSFNQLVFKLEPSRWCI